jgi:hypothetical protein
MFSVTGSRHLRRIVPRWTGSIAYLACGCGLMIGCGSSGGPRLGAPDAAKLRTELAAAEAASGRGDRAMTLDLLGRFKGRIDRLAAAGQLAPNDARALKAGLSQALAAAERQLKPPAPAAARVAATQPTTVPAPPPAPKRAHPAPAHHPKHPGKPDKGKKGSD